MEPPPLPRRLPGDRHRRGAAQRATLPAAVLVAALGCGSCRGAPEPETMDGSGASTLAASTTATSTYDKQAWLARHPRDDAGNLLPRSIPPPIPSAEIPPPPKREPDWDLDPDDPARDYVRIYAIATKRYGESPDCVEWGRSTARPDGRRVAVTAAAGCADAGAVRDVFLVDVAGDRLTLDDKSSRAPLARWPDGSDPEGPPTHPVRQSTSMRDWKSPLHDALTRAQLVPIRLQAYGRSTYSVVTLAGWHGLVQPQTAPESLKAFAQDLCKANAQLPLAFFGGINRSTVLRVRCAGDRANHAIAWWDKL